MIQPRFKIKKGDFVEVMVGKDKGKRGRVLKVFLKKSSAIVEGAHEVKRHVKPSEEHPEGSFMKTLPIHLSNLAIVDISVDKPGRVGYRFSEDGEKIRYFKKTKAKVEKK
ncbi:MAG: 50S ribosomal protein L24 [Alphaproteobacteria bacterium]